MALHFRHFLIPVWALVLVKTHLVAQENSSDFQRHSNIYISVGAGSSMLRQSPSDIYFSGSTNLQLGAMYERAFHKRFSWVAGVEFEQVSYNLDADIELTSPSTLSLVRAGDDKKYTSIRQRNIAFPLQMRAYFYENNNADTKNMFVQTGVRLVQTLDFIGSENLGSTYFYRSRGEDNRTSISDFTNPTLLQAELMIGFKGQFFKKIDLLNASTLGFMYQFTPMLKNGSTAVFPVHFTWRFLF
ncbi:hypothetical protein L0P88_08925 [Muricauda sp. SCSIO 64092]|uniref:hypothetical protein n=1 Tax=Allomuricauda sp. SCSIO 64092 TaxID=2908842 RepID=UPI001FF65216|nr:hypothetical protein [Muricauda sp. SCSIO 64092]UOY08661.1 hypothetical protein L0P88_08925 [Muricauda sp. SCSIO 64092]